MERFKVTEQPEEPEAEVDTPDSTDEPGQEGNRYTVPLKDADSPAKEKVEEDVLESIPSASFREEAAIVEASGNEFRLVCKKDQPSEEPLNHGDL